MEQTQMILTDEEITIIQKLQITNEQKNLKENYLYGGFKQRQNLPLGLMKTGLWQRTRHFVTILVMIR